MLIEKEKCELRLSDVRLGSKNRFYNNLGVRKN